MYVSMGTRRGNCCYNDNFVADLNKDYTAEEKAALLRGEEIPALYDDNNNVIEWNYLCD